MTSQASEADQVAHYFDTHAVDFDSIYEDASKGALRRLRDRLSRGTVIKRLDYVMAFARREQPATVLDVGCGAGRFDLPLAGRGAHVTGLDFAEEMIALATQRAQAAGLGERCTFLATDYLSWKAPAPFDLTLACGVFDYVSDPKPLMEKMPKDTAGTLILSFPKKWHPLVPLRAWRLKREGCPVFFYTRRQVEVLADRYLGGFQIESFGRDYLLSGRPVPPRAA